MTKETSSIKLAWRSVAGRRAAWAIIISSFALLVTLGSLVRVKEQQLRTNTLVQTAKAIANTALSGDAEETDNILLKVNDLISIDTVLGVRLINGADTPLSVGETSSDFITKQSTDHFDVDWGDTKSTLDIALHLKPNLPYSHLIMRLDAETQMAPPFLGTLINWVAAPLIAFINGIVCLWIFGNYFLRPITSIQTYFEESNGKYALAPIPQDLRKRDDETGLIACHVETMRLEVNEAKTKIEFQARFLHETPYPLLRCSVNRKVLYANVAAKSENALFGDESKEFVSPALSELVRKAFYEAKQVSGEIRSGDYIRTFRAIPVLDAGYVNLYGEDVRKIDKIT